MDCGIEALTFGADRFHPFPCKDIYELVAGGFDALSDISVSLEGSL
jgi:hypothetical protein